MAPPKLTVLERVLERPASVLEMGWNEVASAFAPSTLAKVVSWLRIAKTASHFNHLQRLTLRHMTGRVGRQAVIANPDVKVPKAYRDATVTFGLFEKAVGRFALDVMKAPGFSHEPGIVTYMYEAIDSRTLLVDLGAHFGYFSCLAAARGGTVLAVELQPTLCRNIEANLVLNDAWRIHVICAAAGPEPGITQVERLDPSPGKQVMSREFETGPAPMDSVNHDLVPVVTVDSLVGSRFDDAFDKVIVKMDIEGAEVLALRGSTATIAAGTAIFIVEIHISEIAKYGGSMEEVLDLFPEDRWRAVRMDDDGEAESDHAALLALRDAWVEGDYNICVRFEPKAGAQA